jgi:hypothetical protein
MGIRELWNIKGKRIQYQDHSSKIGDTVEELEMEFESKHEWMLAAWDYNFEDVMFTNDLGPR